MKKLRRNPTTGKCSRKPNGKAITADAPSQPCCCEECLCAGVQDTNEQGYDAGGNPLLDYSGHPCCWKDGTVFQFQALRYARGCDILHNGVTIPAGTMTIAETKLIELINSFQYTISSFDNVCRFIAGNFSGASTISFTDEWGRACRMGMQMRNYDAGYGGDIGDSLHGTIWAPLARMPIIFFSIDGHAGQLNIGLNPAANSESFDCCHRDVICVVTPNVSDGLSDNMTTTAGPGHYGTAGVVYIRANVVTGGPIEPTSSDSSSSEATTCPSLPEPDYTTFNTQLAAMAAECGAPASSTPPTSYPPGSSHPASSHPASSHATSSHPTSSHPASSHPASSHPPSSHTGGGSTPPASSHASSAPPASSYPASSAGSGALMCAVKFIYQFDCESNAVVLGVTQTTKTCHRASDVYQDWRLASQSGTVVTLEKWVIGEACPDGGASTCANPTAPDAPSSGQLSAICMGCAVTPQASTITIHYTTSDGGTHIAPLHYIDVYAWGSSGFNVYLNSDCRWQIVDGQTFTFADSNLKAASPDPSGAYPDWHGRTNMYITIP